MLSTIIGQRYTEFKMHIGGQEQGKCLWLIVTVSSSETEADMWNYWGFACKLRRECLDYPTTFGLSFYMEIQFMWMRTLGAFNWQNITLSGKLMVRYKGNNTIFEV